MIDLSAPTGDRPGRVGSHGQANAVAAAAGVPLDFDTFYLEHRDEIGRALAFTVGDHALGFEAVDEAMARAYARWPTMATAANPAGWVYRVGFNWATSFLRRRTRAARHGRPPQAEPAAAVTPPDVDLVAALARLPVHHRAVVVLRYFCDWSVADTAEALGVPAGTVKSRLARALDQLRADLAGRPASSEPTPQAAGRRRIGR